MNKLIIPALLAATLCVAPAAHAAFPTLAEREARLLKSYRDNPNAEDLVGLSHVREYRGKYAESLQTWGLLKKTFGTSYSHAHTGKDDRLMTYNQLADWTAKRIGAKRRGVKQAPLATRRAAQRNFDKYPSTDKTANAVLVDLNGDGLKEKISYVGGGRFLRVHVWNDGMWDSVWQSLDDMKISDDYLITGGEGKGWPQVFLIYTSEDNPNGDSGHLMTNGDSWIVIYN